jgi:hypothetical protein
MRFCCYQHAQLSQFLPDLVVGVACARRFANPVAREREDIGAAMVLAKNLDCLLAWRRALLKFRKSMSSRGQLNVPSSMFK